MGLRPKRLLHWQSFRAFMQPNPKLRSSATFIDSHRTVIPTETVVAHQLSLHSFRNTDAPFPNKIIKVQVRAFSSVQKNEENFPISIRPFLSEIVNAVMLRAAYNVSGDEGDDLDRGTGWILKALLGCSALYAGWYFLPYMGGSLIEQSIALLRVKDPLYKRMGASRVTRFAIDDERRRKIVELGGVTELVKMLQTAEDDKTRRAAMKALSSLSKSDVAVKAMFSAGALSVVHSIAESGDDHEILSYKLKILTRFHDLKLMEE